jgi:exosome complex RNA-binding protein Csl4
MATAVAPLLGKVVAPGHRLCVASGHTCGNGVYRRGEFLYASVVGTVTARREAAAAAAAAAAPAAADASAEGVSGPGTKQDAEEARRPAVRVEVLRQANNNDTVVPKVGDVVVAKVVKITARFAKVEIAIVGGKTLVHTVRVGPTCFLRSRACRCFARALPVLHHAVLNVAGSGVSGSQRPC